MEPLLGSLLLVPYTHAPKGWMFCHGQILSIRQHSALFSLLGTAFGGNGTTNFALPDLRGRVPIGSGQGPGLQDYNLGQVGGAESATAVAHTGAGHPVEIRQPFLTLNWIIAVNGAFPNRD